MAPVSRLRYVTNRLFIAGFAFTITVGGGGQACLCGWSGGSDADFSCTPYSEHYCDDGLDDDEDGFIDCQDSDCAGDPACMESDCDNDLDDDGDYLVDCADPDCEGDPACLEHNCSNSLDDDLDGLVDCADPDCQGGPDCHEICDDEVDNDFDGWTDCVDPECAADLACAQSIQRVTLLQTSGLRSHANGVGCLAEYAPLDATGFDPVLGGYARLAGRIETIRAEQAMADGSVVTLDTGDFMTGAIYDHVVTDPLQLRFFQRVGYDAIGLGDGELARSPDGLAALLTAAASPLQPPALTVPIVASNLVFDASDTADDALQAALQQGVIRDQTVVTLSGGLVVGILGRVGPDVAAATLHAAPPGFDQNVATWQVRVDGLVADHAPDLVILMSHGSIEANGIDTDRDLALALYGVDVIATAAPAGSDQAVQVAQTILFPSGPDGTYLSQLDLTFERDQGVVLSFNHTLIAIDANSAADASVQQEVDGYTAALDLELLNAFGVGSASPVVETTFAITHTPQTETRLGNLSADALRAAASHVVADTSEATPFAVALVPDRMVGDDLGTCTSGVVTFADLYRALPYGMTPAADQDPNWPGWPLVSFYLTAPDLRSVAEALTSNFPLGPAEDFLSYSGIRLEISYSRPPGEKVETLYLCGDTRPTEAPYFGDGDLFSEQCATPIVELGMPWYIPDYTTLYRVVTDLRTAWLLRYLGAAAYPFTLKDAAGQPLTADSLSDLLPYRVDADVAPGVQELKAWQALHWFVATQLQDLGGLPGVPEIPDDKYGPTGSGMGRLQ